MKKILFFVALASAIASCAPSQNVARSARYYKRKEMNANGPLFPGSKPCCISCLEVHF